MSTQVISGTKPQGFLSGKLSQFGEAVQRVWFYAASGIALGTGLVLLATLLETVQPLDKIVEHLGMGFIVAATAVVLYEWGAHYKEGMQLSRELRELRYAVGENALEGSLRAIIRSDVAQHDEEIIRDVKSFVLSVSNLQQHGDWARDGYTRYLARLLHSVTQNAERLCAVSTESRKHPETAPEYHVQVPSPAELADIMLAEQIGRLPEGGKYSISSDLGSWTGGQLHRLHAASEKGVCTTGIIIRRIFVLAETGPHKPLAGPDKVREVLNRHIEATTAWKHPKGSYKIKLFDGEMQRELRQSHPEAADTIFTEHFGIFEWPGKEHRVRIQVKEHDLSELRIGGLPPESRQAQRFEDVWNKLPELTSELLEEVLRRWKAA